MIKASKPIEERIRLVRTRSIVRTRHNQLADSYESPHYSYLLTILLQCSRQQSHLYCSLIIIDNQFVNLQLLVYTNYTAQELSIILSCKTRQWCSKRSLLPSLIAITDIKDQYTPPAPWLYYPNCPSLLPAALNRCSESTVIPSPRERPNTPNFLLHHKWAIRLGGIATPARDRTETHNSNNKRPPARLYSFSTTRAIQLGGIATTPTQNEAGVEAAGGNFYYKPQQNVD